MLHSVYKNVGGIIMDYHHANEFDSFAPAMFGFIGGMALFIVLIVALFGLVAYILTAISTYSIAKRRGIQHPWLAWIPVANTWILGCISDQYQYVVKGKVKYRRVILLVLALASLVLSGWISGSYFSMFRQSVIYGRPVEAVGPALAVSAVGLASSCVSIAAAVFHYISMYDLYTSCNPEYNVLFLVLSIVFSITEPFFMIANHKKDLGMPPRRPNYQQTTYQNDQSGDPWEN